MTEKDIKPLAQMLDFLAEGIGAEMTAVRHRFYYSCLSDLDIQDIKSALNKISRTITMQIMPKPGEIRAAIEGNTEDKALLAWTVAQKNKNAWVSIKFEDKAIHGTVEAMGGWVKFCQMDDYKEEAWQMKDFIKMYKVVGDRECPEYLLGEAEIRNSEQRFEEFIEPPRQVLCDYSSNQKQLKED